MSNADWVTLAEIQEEIHLVIDPETGKKVRKPAYFAGMKTLIQGAYSFVTYFEKMHEAGRVYAGNDPAGFVFNLKTGDMICRQEALFEEESVEGNVKKEREKAIALQEFAAPELLEAYEREEEFLTFDIETDRYFMAVFLFEYFFHTGSPFEGKMMVNRCFLSPLEKEMFRVDQGIFCMDLGDHENQPVKGIQDKLIRYWNAYPERLQKAFIRAFLHGGTAAQFRPSSVDWMQLFVQLTMDYKECDCGFHGFSFSLKEQENGTRICPKCGKLFYPLTNGMDTIWLAQGQKLYECQTGRSPFNKNDVTGIVVENKQRKGLYGIKNLSKGSWRCLFPDGTTREVGTDQAVPIWNGMRIRFEIGEDWYLRLIQTEIQFYDVDDPSEDSASITALNSSLTEVN